MFDENIGLEFPVTVYGNLEKYNENREAIYNYIYNLIYRRRNISPAVSVYQVNSVQHRIRVRDLI